MSVGSMAPFFDDGKMYMYFKCMKCKVKNKVCVNLLLEKKASPKCGKCKRVLIDQLDVDEITASIHPDELIPQIPAQPEAPPGAWDGVDPYEEDEEGDDWVI